MRVRRGVQWEKVRQSQKEREKDLLRKFVVSDLEFDRRYGEGDKQDQIAATTVSPNLGVQRRSLEHSTEDEEGRAVKRKHLPISLAQAAMSGIQFRTPGVGWRCLATAPRQGCEPNSPSMSNVLLNQPGRASLPKVVHPAQSISEKERDHEAIKEAAFIPVHNTEEINSELIWERIQKVHDESVSLSELTSTKLLEQANKLVMENKCLKDGQIVLLQQVKDQKQMIDELSKQNRALVQKCTEVDCLKEQTAQLIKDKEELQRRVSQANELLKLMKGALFHGD